MPTPQTTQALVIRQTGGPEVLKWEEVALPPVGDTECLIRHDAVGINFIDIYNRTGLYPQKLPFGLGTEAAGSVVKIGAKVTAIKVGDRVAYCTGPLGAYARERVISEGFLVRVPESIAMNTAAGMMLKGLTAQYLLRQTFAVKAGDWLLNHAAAGGVGLIIGQWAKHLGAHAIGVVSNAEKAHLAKEHGYEEVINLSETPLAQLADKVRQISGGGVAVVYDSVGKDTFNVSLDCLRPRGLMVSFGNASGAVEPFSPGILAQKGSLYLTRPTLFGYAHTPQALQVMAQELFAVVHSGAVKIHINQTYRFSEVARAHEDLAARKTTGSSVLIPD